jgi:pyruvate/2-oxoacid:ferredoxin oxidoreductase alpha subunit
VIVEREVRLMQGNQAMSEASIYAGARFYAGYPITPSSEIAEECSKVMLQVGGVSMHGPDGYSNNDPANAAWRVDHLHWKIELHREEIVLAKSFAAEEADVLLIAFEVTTRASRAAALELREEGKSGRRDPEALSGKQGAEYRYN